MFNNNIGNIRWRMTLDFIAGKFTMVTVALTAPFTEVFLLAYEPQYYRTGTAGLPVISKVRTSWLRW